MSPAHRKKKPAEVPPEGYGFAWGCLGEADGWRIEQAETPQGAAQLVISKDGEELRAVPMLFPEPLTGKRTRYAEVQWHALPEPVTDALAGRVDPGKGDLPVHQLVAALLLRADLRACAQPDGKPLTVHHLDEHGLNNAAGNLLPLSGPDHTRLHTAGTEAERETITRKWEEKVKRETPQKGVTIRSQGEKKEREGEKRVRGSVSQTSSLTNPHPVPRPLSGASGAPSGGHPQGKSPGGSGTPAPRHLPQAPAGPPRPAAPKPHTLIRPGMSQSAPWEARVIRALRALGGGATAGDLSAELQRQGAAQRASQVWPRRVAKPEGPVTMERRGKSVWFELVATQPPRESP